LLTIAAACGQGSADRAPISPSAVSTANDSGGQAVQGRQDVQVTMQDACDPATFNAAIGPGTCLRSGGVSFDEFVAQLTKHGAIGAWHFAPPNANVRVGQTFLATNNGGEVHTFTQVADFGGGIVPFLNQLTGEATVAPECNALEPDDFVAPGGTYKEDVEHTGTLKFQCCIHPWMRLEARASTH
jgi:plastocyanin